MSKACLDFAKGMHLKTVASAEFQLGKDWHRAEVYRNDAGKLTYAGYIRMGAYWRPVTSEREPTNSPEVLDQTGRHLLHQARKDEGELPL